MKRATGDTAKPRPRITVQRKKWIQEPMGVIGVFMDASVQFVG